MKQVRRGKINSMIKLKELRNLRECHPEMNSSAGWLLEHADKLISVRSNLVTNDDFTSNEYHDTREYVEFMQSENYEKLIDFKVIED